MDYVTPTARSVFLCFHVADAGHGNVHLGWVFNAIRPEGYPDTEAVICVVLQLSDGLGDVPVAVNLIRLPDTPDEEPRLILATDPTIIHFADRLVFQRVVLRLPQCTFPEPGRYAVEILCGKEYLGDALILLRPLEEAN
jgi:hypothetical protein